MDTNSEMSFHGIGPKTAALVLLFSFNAAIVPVDNGILRVVKRLRLVRARSRDLEAERVISPLVTRGQHHAMHLLLYTHAKQTCRPRNPKGDQCKLLPLCPFGQRRMKHRPPEERIEPVLRMNTRKKILARFVSAGIAKRGELEEPE